MWYYESLSNSLPTSPPISQGYNFIIHPVENRHQGYYFCYGLFEEMNEHFIAKSSLKVQGSTVHSIVMSIECAYVTWISMNYQNFCINKKTAISDYSLE